MFFLANVKICNFLQLFYMRETDNMVRVKVVPIDVLYQSANFWHPVSETCKE